MSLEQYKDASRKELWDILQIQMQVLQAEAAKVAELEKTLRLTHKDLLMRAEEDSHGCKVVDLSSFVWDRVKEALKEQGND